jgi:hypothetical protein
VGGGAYVAQNVLGSNVSNSTSTETVAGRNPGAGAARQPEAGAAGHPEVAVPNDLQLHRDALKSQLYSALRSKQILHDLENGPSPSASLDQVAGGCVSSALGARTPANWMSYRVTFDSRPAVLVLSRAGIESTKVWVVECQPSPTVTASTVIPAR